MEKQFSDRMTFTCIAWQVNPPSFCPAFTSALQVAIALNIYPADTATMIGYTGFDRFRQEVMKM